MIDTVKLKFEVQPGDEELRAGWSSQLHHNLATDATRTMFVYNDPPVKATFYPEDYKGHPLFYIELSLPGVMYGYNWPMIPDLPSAIAAVDDLFHKSEALPHIPTCADGQLIRLDACYSYLVGDTLLHYLGALNKLDYPHRQTVPFMGTGVEYRCLTSKTKFYDKGQEARKHKVPPELLPPAGTLRHETNYNKTRPTSFALGFTEPVRLEAVTLDRVLDILQRDLKHLGIYGCVFATQDNTLRELRRQCEPATAMRIFGALSAYQDRDKKTLADELDVSNHTITRYLREAARLGISRAFADLHDLPPLEIVWPPDPRYLPQGRLIAHKKRKSTLELIEENAKRQLRGKHAKLSPSPGDTLGTWADDDLDDQLQGGGDDEA